ncbi:MAG TPA: S41 family peptidase [Steroidobacter sp.]
MTGYTRARRASALATFVLACCWLPAPALFAAGATAPQRVVEPGRVEASGRGWLEDLETLKAELEASYPNLLWKGSQENGVDLPALASATEHALRRATTDQEAFQAITAFIDGIRDGHLYVSDTDQSADPPPSEARELFDDAASACASIGYIDYDGDAYSLPFEAAGRFELIRGSPASDFRTGVVTTAAGQKVAVLRIASFLSGNLVAACEASFMKVSVPVKHADWPRWCAARCVDDLRDQTIARSIAFLRRDLDEAWRRGARTLLIDVGQNPGGEGWAWDLAQSLAGTPLDSPPLGVVADGRLDRYLSIKTDELHATAHDTRNDQTTREAALAAHDALLDFRIAATSSAPCDLSWVWTERRRWSVDALWNCGRVARLPIDASGELLLEGAVIAPGKGISRRLGVDVETIGWRGSLTVLVDRDSVSAAELFAGYLQDANAALVIGEQTRGAGCGFIGYNRSTIVLPTSGLQVVVPDCVILRKDGRNSVAGVRPDVPIDRLYAENLALFAARTVKAASTATASEGRSSG